MRKSHVLATVIAVVLIGLSLLAWSLVSRPAGKVVDDPELVAATAEIGRDSTPPVELESALATERTDLALKMEREAAAPTSSEHSLRIEVQYAPGSVDPEEGLEVGISNRMGTLFKPRRVESNVFVLPAAAPDAYIVRARAPGFRTHVAHARVAAKTQETRVAVTLVPEHRLRVRWRSNDGHPISVGVARAEELTGSVRLHVYATKFRLSDTPPLDRHALDVLRRELVITDAEPDGRVVFDKRAEWVTPEAVDERTASDVFGELSFDEDGVVFVSAFVSGVCVASLPVDSGQSEIEIVTALADATRGRGAVSLVVVDDRTSQPVAGAALHVDSASPPCVADADGRISCPSLPPGPRAAVVRAEDYADRTVRFTVRAGETADLGTVRLESVHPEAFFSVVDGEGRNVANLGFELRALDQDADEALPILSTYFARSTQGVQPTEASPSTNLQFEDVQRGHYLLLCKAQGVDAPPRSVSPADLRSAPNRTAIATIVVEPAFKASFVLDPPFVRGTEVRLETTSGLPLRELDVDEFGVAATEIMPGRYRLHLIEYGRATAAVDVLVDTNPFVFEIHR